MWTTSLGEDGMLNKVRSGLIKVGAVVLGIHLLAGAAGVLLPYLLGAAAVVTIVSGLYRRRW